MAYGLKYTLRYQVDKTNQDVKIKIYENGYLGANTFKKIGASRIILSKEKDEKICGTSLDFSIQADVDFEYTNFFNSDNKTHRVDMLIDDVVTWSGYIVSDQYSEPYIAPPFDVEVLCTDGLGLLKTEDFGLAGYVSRFTAIKYCLDKIGLQLGYQINLDLWEANMNPALHNMLDQLYFQAEIMEEKTCYEVIQALLPEGTTITQHESKWLIERTADIELIPGPPEDYLLPKPRYYFDSSGVFENYETSANLYAIGTLAEYKTHPIGNLTMGFRPAWKNFTIKQIFGKKQSFFSNYDFTKGTDYWTQVGAVLMLKTYNLDSGTFGLIRGTQTTSPLTKYISQSVKVKTSDVIVFSFDYSPIGYNTFGSGASMTLGPTEVTVHFKIKFVGESGTTYYHNQQAWIETDYTNKLEHLKTDVAIDSINFKTFKITGSKLPENGVFTVMFYQLYYPVKPLMGTILGLALKNVLLYTQNIALFNNEEETKVILADNATEEGETIELMPTDLPDYDNANMYFLNGNFTGATIETATPCALWGPSSVRYIEYLAAFIDNQNSVKRATLSGQLSNSIGLHLNMYFIHALNSGKIFTIETGRWNVLDHTIDVTLLEVVPISTAAVVVTPEPFNPETVFTADPDIIDWTSIGNEGSYTRLSDGIFEHIFKDTDISVVVSRKETITPWQLDYDSGTPQFSIKGGIVDVNVGGNPNAVSIGAGTMFSHNFYSLPRPEIKLLTE